jgi:hypothetical protein
VCYLTRTTHELTTFIEATLDRVVYSSIFVELWKS